MDIISNLTTQNITPINQTADLSQHFNFKENGPSVDEAQELDASLGEIALKDGQDLPPHGKASPPKLDFNAVLESEVAQIESTQPIAVQTIEQPISDVLIPEETIPLQAFAPLINTVVTDESKSIEFTQDVQVQQDQHEQTEYLPQSDHSQQNENLNAITHKAIVLKEINHEIEGNDTPFNIVNNNELEQTPVAKQAPVIFDKSTFEKDIADKDKKVLQMVKNYTDTNQKVNANSEKEVLPVQLLKAPDFKAHSQKEHLGNALQQESQEANNTQDYSLAQYQVSANQVQDKAIQLPQGLHEKPIVRETFEQDLSQKVQLMINAKEQSAKVEVSPQDLGNIEIKIVQEADKMHISFIASQIETQQLIEASLDKLKHQVQMHGLDLGNVSVSHQNSSSGQQMAKNKGYKHVTQDSAINVPSAVLNTMRSPTSMLDIYA